MNQHQSAAMWKLYLKTDEGMAIQTTFRRLKESLKTAREKIFAGMVNYIDYEKERFPVASNIHPFVHKRRSFAHEMELRAFYWHATDMGAILGGAKEPTETGFHIQTDLDTLIDAIFVAPTSPAWFRDLTEAVVRKYGLNKSVVRSNLDDGPVW